MLLKIKRISIQLKLKRIHLIQSYIFTKSYRKCLMTMCLMSLSKMVFRITLQQMLYEYNLQ